MALIKQTEWAKKHGFSHQYVSKLVKQGKIHLVEGMIDEDYADIKLKIISNPTFPRKNATLENRNLHEQYLQAKIHSETEKARILELERIEKEGTLVDIEEVKKTAFIKARTLRDKILNIPDRISAGLVGIDEVSKIHEVLTKELRLCLEEFSND